MIKVNHALTQPSQITAYQCIKYLATRPTLGGYTINDVRNTIVPTYFSLCAVAKLDAGILIAQMLHETGFLTSWWSQRDRRNPAGIGVTGRSQDGPPLAPPRSGSWVLRDDGKYHEGVKFASWQNDAIPAHVGRVLAYVLTDAQATPLQRNLIAAALAYRPLVSEARGTVKSIKALGAAHNPINTGKGRQKWIGWAVPGFEYGDRIVDIANAMLKVS